MLDILYPIGVTFVNAGSTCMPREICIAEPGDWVGLGGGPKDLIS